MADETTPQAEPQVVVPQDQTPGVVTTDSGYKFHRHTGVDTPRIDTSDLLGFPIDSTIPNWTAEEGEMRLSNDGTLRAINIMVGQAWRTVAIGNPISGRLHRGVSAQTIPDITATTVQLNVITFGGVGITVSPNTGSHRFTAVTAGRYSVSGGVTYISPAADAYYQAEIRVNGARVSAVEVHSSNTNPICAAISDTVNLAVGDYVQLWTFHNSSADKDIYGNPDNTWLSIIR